MDKKLKIVLVVILSFVGLFLVFDRIYANIGQPVANAAGSGTPAVIEKETPMQQEKQGEPKNLPENQNPPGNTNLTETQNQNDVTNTNTSQNGVENEPTPIRLTPEVASIAVLVNRQSVLAPEYVPEDLTTVKVKFAPQVLSERKKMRKEAAIALENLFKGADIDGIMLYGVSGYRSYQTQRLIYEAKVKGVGTEEADRFVAQPGRSEHQTGLAMDLTNVNGRNKPLNQAFGASKEGKWLLDNAHKYGFIIRYPAGKEQITGYSYEPWHVRYVGIEAAEVIKEGELCLEEYIAKIRI